jgi:hypothetical protein
MHRLVVGFATLLVVVDPVAARPPPDQGQYEIASDPKPTRIEWTTWLRGAIVVASGDPAPTTDGIARAVSPASSESHRDVAGAVGIGLTLPLGHRVRVGAWAEVRGWDLPLLGGELTVIPGDLDLFHYKGKSAVTVRAGGNPDLLTAQLGIAYRAPWDLFGDRPRNSRYMIGAGLVATVTQSRFDRSDWSATVGLEFEPLGAIRYLLGIKSWY